MGKGTIVTRGKKVGDEAMGERQIRLVAYPSYSERIKQFATVLVKHTCSQE